MRTDRIGDVILTLPLARVLKRFRPDAHVAVLIHSYTAELAGADPAVDEVIAVDSHAPPVAATVARIRRSRFDVALHTHPRPRFALITALSRIPVRVGTGYRWYSLLFNRRVYEHRKDARRHELEYNLNLLTAIGLAPPWGDVHPRIAAADGQGAAAASALASAGIPPGARFAILHPGSGGSAREWSPERFAELARLLSGVEGLSVVVTGGPGEEGLVRRVLDRCPPGVRGITGLPGIGEFAALARRASLFVANSTGPLHVAAAVGTPVIGLYSQVTALSAARWGPWSDRKAIFTPAGFPADCAACSGAPGTACACMDSISPEAVYSAAVKLLAGEVTVA